MFGILVQILLHLSSVKSKVRGDLEMYIAFIEDSPSTQSSIEQAINSSVI